MPLAPDTDMPEQEDSNGLYEHFRFVADKGQQLLRVDKFLVSRLEKSSRNRVQQAAEAGCVLVNGKAVKSNYRVKPLDVVSVVMDRPRYECEIVAEDIPLDIVYEDDMVLVVNKPAGLVVHPGHGNYSGTLVNALAWHFRDSADYDVNDPRLGLVHRIDKDTSGLLVVAKTPDAKTALGRQFFDKTTKREMLVMRDGKVRISADRPLGQVKTVDLSGRLVTSTDTENTDLTLDLSSVNDGLYIIMHLGSSLLQYRKDGSTDRNHSCLTCTVTAS